MSDVQFVALMLIGIAIFARVQPTDDPVNRALGWLFYGMAVGLGAFLA